MVSSATTRCTYHYTIFTIFVTNRDRTGDLKIFSLTLSQLSYSSCATFSVKNMCWAVRIVKSLRYPKRFKTFGWVVKAARSLDEGKQSYDNIL